MTRGNGEATLVEQRVSLRRQLRVQRRELAQQLFAPDAQARFPRSITMRVLIDRPDLVARLLTLIVGARLARQASTLIVVAGVLGAASRVSGFAHRREPALPV